MKERPARAGQESQNDLHRRAAGCMRVAKDDLIAKLREANVLDLTQVRAVILETTGDVSVLHGDECADELLQGTRRLDR